MAKNFLKRESPNLNMLRNLLNAIHSLPVELQPQDQGNLGFFDAILQKIKKSREFSLGLTLFVIGGTYLRPSILYVAYVFSMKKS